METFNEHLHDVKQRAWHFTSNVCLKPRQMLCGQYMVTVLQKNTPGSMGLGLGSANHVECGRSGTGPPLPARCRALSAHGHFCSMPSALWTFSELPQG